MGAESEAEAANFRSLFEQKEKELVRMCTQKEKELVEMCDQEIKHLQQQVLDRGKDIAELSAKFCLLKEDFKYNLVLLDGRDAELSNYEAELSTLQESAKDAAKNLQETHQKLAASECQRLQERSRAEEKDKLYQRTLLDIREQMESLQLTREQLLIMHKQAFETASAELTSEVRKKQVDLELHSKLLEAQSLDKLRIQELQSQVVLDRVNNKLSLAEATIKQLGKERDEAEQQYVDAETELRAQVRERDKTIKQLSMELKQLRSEKDDIKSKADLESSKSKEKLQCLEAEHQQVLQMVLQIEDLQKRLETAESRLTRCNEQQPGEVGGYLAKVEQLAQEMMTQENEMNMKLEGVEAYVRQATQLQDQKVQDLETEAMKWKSEHAVLLSKYASLQKELEGGNATQEVIKNLNCFLQDPHVDPMGTKKEQSTMNYNHELGIPGVSILPPRHNKEKNGTSSSIGSSLPAASPLPSPTFSNFEESLQLRLFNKIQQSNKELQDHDKVHITIQNDKNSNPVNLENESGGFQASAQNMEDQDIVRHFNGVVGPMLEDMEAMQAKAWINEGPEATNGGVYSTNEKKEEIRILREEVHLLALELQRARQQKAEVSLNQHHIHTPYQRQQVLHKIDNESEMPRSASNDNPQSTAKIAELERVQSVLSASNDNPQSSAKIAELERVQSVLRLQLQRAAADIVKMTNERDCLMEISNSLHADFYKFVQQNNFKQGTPTPTAKYCGNNLGHVQTITTRRGDEANNEGKTITSSSDHPYSSPPKISNKASIQGAPRPSIQDQVPEMTTLRGSKKAPYKHIETKSASIQPQGGQVNEEVVQQRDGSWLHLEGKMKSLKERPELIPDYVHKGIPSQRSKLQQSIKRRDIQMATQMANRVKIRNYNIKDDDVYKWQ